MKKLVFLMASAVALIACGPPASAPVFRPQQLASATSLDGPFWIAFEAGDVIPLHADVAGPLFELKTEQPVPIRIKRSFYLLLGDGKPRLSLDRKSFVEGGGSFRFGVGATKERGTFAEIVVRHHGNGEP